MKRVCKRLLVVSITCLSLGVTRGQFQKSESNETTVIVGGTLIDATGRVPLRDSVIVIKGNTIETVGERGKVTYPQNARVIDAAGKFVLPSFFDSHVHYREWLPEVLLAHGVTSIIDMGNPTDWILAQRDGITKGKIIGPRIWASGGQLGTRDQARNPEEGRKVVRELIAKGVNKIATTMLIDPETTKVIVEEAHKAGIPVSAWTMYPREVAALGLDALEHSYTLWFGTKKGRALEELRRDHLEPPPRYERNWRNYLMEADNDDFIDLLVKHGTFIIPDLVFDFKIINDRYQEFERQNVELVTNPNLRYIPVEDWLTQLVSYTEAGRKHVAGLAPLEFGTEQLREWQKVYRIEQNFLKKLIQVGGKVLAGSDAPNKLLPGIALHHELQLLVDAGLTPMQAILSATQWPAQFLRQQNRLGTVEPGKLADLLILRADPLRDIANTRTIDLVIKDGRILDTTYHPDFANPLPRGLVSESQMNQVPTVTIIVPQVATEGDSDIALTIRGRDFMKSSLAAFDGQWLPTVFVTERELKASIPSRLLSRVGTFPVTVWNPRPFGGMSADVKLYVKFK